jgi:hypothetical protein
LHVRAVKRNQLLAGIHAKQPGNSGRSSGVWWLSAPRAAHAQTIHPLDAVTQPHRPSFPTSVGKLTKRHTVMDEISLPLHEQLMLEQWRRMVEQAGPGDLGSLKTLSLKLIEYAATSRKFALTQAAALLPRAQNSSS